MDQSEYGHIVVYEGAEGAVQVEVRLERDTVWLTLGQMADLFGRDKSVIQRHLANVFRSGELDRAAVVAKNATTASDGKTYRVEYFNLDAILSVGYRVNSLRGTQFRIWATRTLRDHVLRGYTLNARRLAERGLGEMQQAVWLLARLPRTHSSPTRGVPYSMWYNATPGPGVCCSNTTKTGWLRDRRGRSRRTQLWTRRKLDMSWAASAVISHCAAKLGTPTFCSVYTLPVSMLYF